jgi:hypothetical protein
VVQFRDRIKLELTSLGHTKDELANSASPLLLITNYLNLKSCKNYRSDHHKNESDKLKIIWRRVIRFN